MLLLHISCSLKKGYTLKNCVVIMFEFTLDHLMLYEKVEAHTPHGEYEPADKANY